MNNQTRQKLQQLFSQFNQEEGQVSSFAVNNLFDRMLRILQEDIPDPKVEKVEEQE